MSRNTEEKSSLRKILGANLKAARTALGITQEQAAARAGISAEFFGRLERGRAMASVSTLLKLAAALNVSIGQLCTLARESDPLLWEQNLLRMLKSDPELRRALMTIVKRMKRK